MNTYATIYHFLLKPLIIQYLVHLNDLENIEFQIRCFLHRP